MAFTPDRGDVVWLTFEPQAGSEQAGRRPALTISPAGYNGRVGLAIFCPITSRVKGYPFEVPLAPDFEVHGAVLSDQVKNLDWRARDARLIGRAPASVISAVVDRVRALIETTV